MTKRSRTLLFFILIVIFILAVPIIILYPQGYRFDFENRRLTQVGAFYFDVEPPRAQIYVNKERIGETSRFIGSNLSKNFLPQTYFVEIRKEGYTPWQKNLEIHPRKVTEAKYITLFPADLNFTLMQSNVLDFWAAPNNSDILLQKAFGNRSWDLTLWDTETNNEYLLFQTTIPQSQIQNIEWAPDSNAYIAQLASGKTMQAFIQEIDRPVLQSGTSTVAAAENLLTPLPVSGNNIQHIAFSPFSTEQIIFLSSKTLSSLHYKTLEAQQKISEQALSFVIQDQDLFWLDTKGILWKKQSANGTAIEISQAPFKVSNKESYTLYSYGKNIFLQTQDMLYWLNEETQEFDEFSPAPAEIALSPDGEKIALSNGNEISIIFLQAQQQQPARQKGEKVLLTRLSGEITNMEWFNSHNLMFTAGDTIKISEIDTRDRINTVDLITTPSPRFFWQPSRDTVYVYSNNQIQASDTLSR